MTNEPSPRQWRAEQFGGDQPCCLVDADGSPVCVQYGSADAALIMDAVNERDRLRDLVREALRAIDVLYTVAAPGAIVKELTPDVTCLGIPIGKIVADARTAIGEGAR